MPDAREHIRPNTFLRYRAIYKFYMPGVGLIDRVAGLGSKGPEFKSRSDVELIPGEVDSACHPSKVGKISASLLISCVGVATCPGLCLIA